MYTYRKACIVQVQAGMCTCRRPCTRTGRHIHVLAGMCTYITSCVHAGGHVHLQTGYARTGRHVHVQAGMCMYKPACASAGRHVHVRARTSTCRRACARAAKACTSADNWILAEKLEQYTGSNPWRLARIIEKR